jgi:hypothetical protein
VKTAEEVELVISVSIDFKVVGPADMMYFPGMAENFPFPAQPIVRDVLRDAVSQMSTKLFTEDTACLDKPLLTALNREFDRKKVGLRVETGKADPATRACVNVVMPHNLRTHTCYSARVVSTRSGGGCRACQRVPRQVAKINRS